VEGLCTLGLVKERRKLKGKVSGKDSGEEKPLIVKTVGTKPHPEGNGGKGDKERHVARWEYRGGGPIPYLYERMVGKRGCQGDSHGFLGGAKN